MPGLREGIFDAQRAVWTRGERVMWGRFVPPCAQGDGQLDEASGVGGNCRANNSNFGLSLRQFPRVLLEYLK